MKTLFIAVFTVLAGLACAASSRSTDTAAVQPYTRDLASLTEAHDAALNAHDAAALADLFVADGSAVLPSGRRVDGRAALLELFAAPGPTKSTISSSAIGKGAP